jgi:hypothetical protein
MRSRAKQTLTGIHHSWAIEVSENSNRTLTTSRLPDEEDEEEEEEELSESLVMTPIFSTTVSMPSIQTN